MSAPQDDLDDLAGQYVLGTLSASARRTVEARMAGEPALRAAVEAWEARLLPLTALAPPAEPSPQLWPRIEGSLGPVAVAVAAAAAANTRPVVRAAPKPAPWWHWDSLPLWRGLAGAGFAAAAILASVVVTRLGAPPPPQYLVVLVAPQDKAPGWVVQTSSSRQLALIPLGTVEVPSEKSLQFWTKADGWGGPVSLGLVTPGRTLQVPIDRLPPLQPNQLFELTLEPPNGSPLDRPTGPIQFIGRAVKVL